MTATAYPLSWPAGFPRAKHREAGQFRTSYESALENVANSLRRFGIDSGKTITDPIMSSNINLLDKAPADAGVAVWFSWDGMQICIPVDRYLSPAANLQAIHHILEARRTELRHGTLNLVRATFQGFRALPPPPHWSEILGIPRSASRAEIETAFKRLAGEHHPDRGGSHERMSEINTARARALEERA